VSYKQYWNQIYEKSDELNSLISSYWNHYSDIGTWRFWYSFFLLTTPLVLLYFKVDRKRIFELFFFGYTVHVLWTYVNIALARQGYFNHTAFLTPVLPFALDITTSVLPVSFLLIYQYCTNNNKNFYLYALLLSAIFAFGFASIEEYFGLVTFRKGMDKFYLYCIDIVVVCISYWVTKLGLKLRDGVRS